MRTRGHHLLEWTILCVTGLALSATAAEPLFVSSQSAQLILRYVPGSAAERDLAKIVSDRERAHENISSVLGFSPKRKIVITIYPDRKSTPSGFGAGETSGGETISINYFDFTPCYEQTRYGHELTHALSFQLLGKHHSLSVLSEGLAEYLDQSGRNLHTELALSSRIWGNRGEPRIEASDVSQGGFYSETAYEKAGSFVKFLIEEYGRNKFLDFYRATADMGSLFSAERLPTFAEKFKKTYGMDLAVAEGRWAAILLPHAELALTRLSQPDEAAIRDLILAQDTAAAAHDSEGIAKAYDRISRTRIRMFEGNLKYYAEFLKKTEIRDILDLGIKKGQRALVRTVRQFKNSKTYYIEYYVEKLEDGWKIQNEDWLK